MDRPEDVYPGKAEKSFHVRSKSHGETIDPTVAQLKPGRESLPPAIQCLRLTQAYVVHDLDNARINMAAGRCKVVDSFVVDVEKGGAAVATTVSIASALSTQ